MTDSDPLQELNDKLLDPEDRVEAAQRLLSLFLDQDYSPDVASSSTIMARAAAHPVFTTLLHSLLFDTGNVLFPIALRCFLAIMPYAPQVVTPHIPLVMVVLGRAASWRDRPFVDHDSTQRDGITRTPLPNPSFGWKLETSASEIKTTLPDTLQPVNITRLLFVAVYGGWPSNVIAFIRDPVAYIHKKEVEPVYDVPWEEVWAPGILAVRSAPLLRAFHLHPSLCSFTSGQELADEKRWDKYDPPKVITRSHMLAHSEKEPGDTVDLFGDIPTESHHPPPEDVSQITDIARLQREVQLLRSEAQFASRIRKLYLYHVGRLHKNSLRFNSDEAEIHSFVNRLKEQNKMVESLTAELAQQRHDATQAQSKHVKWQETLREKLASYREERRTWQAEAGHLRSQLNETTTGLQRLKDELATCKNERFKLQSRMAEVEPKINHLDDYETRMKQLTEQQLLWDADVRRRKEAEDDAEHWRAECYKIETLLRATQKQKVEQIEKNDSLVKQLAAVAREPATRTPSPKPCPDMEFYISVTENAKKRAETLEKENLELKVELEKLKREQAQGQQGVDGDKSFIW